MMIDGNYIPFLIILEDFFDTDVHLCSLCPQYCWLTLKSQAVPSLKENLLAPVLFVNEPTLLDIVPPLVSSLSSFLPVLPTEKKNNGFKPHLN